MRAAAPDALTVDVRPAMIVRVAEHDLARLFPVEFKDVDPLAAPEPTRAALLRLNTGRLLLAEFGTITSTLMISVPEGANADQTLSDLFIEVPISEAAITWIADDAVAFSHSKRG